MAEVAARITRAGTAPAYHPPLHTGVDAVRLQGHEAGPTERFWVGHSTYPPGSSADRSPAAQETVYVVLAGELELTLDDDAPVSLATGDSVHLTRGQVRSVTNSSDADAQLLVVIATPEAAG